MKSRGRRIISMCLVLLLVLGTLPISSQNVKAASPNAPLQEISVEQVKNQGLPVINLDMADSGKYDTLKTVKDKQDIKKFTLYDTDGSVVEVDTKDGVYPLTAKGRGNSSWTMATGKKPYNLKFEKKIDLLGMGKSKSWCIVSNWVDTSYMRNYMAYNLACEMGMGTPDCRQVALCIDDKFEGIYLLTEKVGINEFRTEIPDSPEDRDINGDGKVSEIIVESDSRAYQNSEPGAFTTKGGVYFVPKDPDPEDLAPTELPEIEKEVNAMEAAILSGENYEDYIDVDSWVDTYIINELAKNPDFGFGYQPCYSSSYLYFNEGGKVYAGPVWDFDIAYGRNDYSKKGDEGNRETANPEKFLTANTKYYKELLEKTDFKEHVIRRWKQLKSDGTLNNWLKNTYQAGHDEVDGLVQQDIAIWGGTDKRVAGTFDVGRNALDFEQECAYIKDFLAKRIAWLDTQWDVDEIETPYSAGEWSREKVSTSSANPNYSALTNGNEHLDVVWDGGYGFTENTEAVEKELGKPQGAIPGVPINSITLTLDTTGMNTWDDCVKWYTTTEVSNGFGADGNNSQITVEESGRYIGIAKQASWVSNGTYTMSHQSSNKCWVYIVDVSPDGAVIVHDGTVTIDSSNPCKIEKIDEVDHYGAIEGSGSNFTLKYQSDGNGTYHVPGTGAAVDMKLDVVEGGSRNLTVTKRAAGSKYPEVLDSFESTYIKVTDGMPESWTNSAPEVVSFEEATRKVTALKAGTATITATAGTQNVSLTFKVTEKQATELAKTEIPEAGLYASESYRRENPPKKGTWATAAANQIYRFTYTLDFTEDDFQNLNGFALKTGEKEILSGQGDYYIFVNGKPWLKADSVGTTSDFAGDYKFTANVGTDNTADLTQANAGLVTPKANESDTTQSEFLQVGENTFDIFMISSTDAYIDRPYFYGARKIGEEDPDKPVVDVTGVALDPTNAEVTVGDELTLKATIVPADATNKKLTWTSSDTSVATVVSGKVTALKEGTTTITATSNNGIKGTATIKVNPKPVVEVKEIVLDKTVVNLIEGEADTIIATVKPEDAADKRITWESSDTSVATVANGKITAIAPGNITITVKAVNGVKATATVNVSKKPDVEVESITLNKEKATIEAGKTLQLQATITPSNATNQVLTWKTSAKKVATVDNTGKITAVAEGTATITVTSANGKSAKAVITVIPKPDIENGVFMDLTFVSRENFTSVESPETVVQSGIALLNKDNEGLQDCEAYETENILSRAIDQFTKNVKASKANENSKSKGNANAEYNSSKNGNNGKGNKKNQDIENSDKAELLPGNTGVLLWPGEAIAFAVKDYQATQQILYTDTLDGELTFVTPGKEAQQLDLSSNDVKLPVQKAADGYTYYLIANTGTNSIALKNIWADKQIDWEVSYETLPMMYEMNAEAFGKDSLEMREAKFASSSVRVFKTVDFTVKTTANTSAGNSNLVIRDRFYGDGLYGEVTKTVNVLDNEIVWTGQVRPGKLTSTAFTFMLKDSEGTISENPIKLTIKVTTK